MEKTPKKQKSAPADWVAIEREYRAGQLSDREIGRQHNVSHVAVGKRARKEGWSKNLAPAVAQEIETRLVTDAVTNTVTSGNAREIVDAAASRAVEIVRGHRTAIGRGQKLVQVLFEQLEEAALTREQLEQDIIAETDNDEHETRRNAMLKAVSLPGHASVLKDLSTALGKFVVLERQAFNIDAKHGDANASGVMRVPATMSEDEWEQQRQE